MSLLPLNPEAGLKLHLTAQGVFLNTPAGVKQVT